MKIAVIGADGFIGRSVNDVLSRSHEVYAGVRSPEADYDERRYHVDLLAKETIARFLREVQPEVIISCAGVIDATRDVSMNEVFTHNLLDAIVNSGLDLKRIVISGSAGEYGVVNPANLPIKETEPLNATAGYGLSKCQEEATALRYREEYHLPVVVARIFNPIGVGMQSKFLISRIIDQVAQVRAGERDAIEIGRIDAERDYVAVEDISYGIKAIIEGVPHESVYNIGSGVATSNGQLAKLILDNSTLSQRPDVIQINDQPEPQVASQADITRMRDDFGWSPVHAIEDIVKEIVYVTEAAN